jgi:hypothetical protein
MARITDQEIERHLANKFEGRVFVEIHLAKINGNEFRINKDFYTVKKGKVYMILGEKLEPTDDSMMNVNMDCKPIGVFNPNKNYVRKQKNYSYKEFKKLHRI